MTRRQDPTLVICLVVGVATAVVVLVIFLATPPRPSKRTSSVPELQSAAVPQVKQIIPIRAEDLLYAYEENGVRADLKYKGKRFAVTGRIADVQNDLAGDPFILIDGAGQIASVRCSFRRDEVRKLAKLKIGQDAVVVGRGGGQGVLTVLVEDCTLAD